jgi:hypothetical protein
MSRFTTTRPTRASSAPSVAFSVALSVALLSACAGYSPGDLRPGAAEADVRARMGEPTGRHPLADGGARIEYARGPTGRHTYMVEVDSAGRVRGWEQVLTERNFESVAVGTAQADVRQRLGRPSQTRTGWRGAGEVWSYRFDDLFCRWFQIWLIEGQVREASYAPDPRCDEPRRDLRSD